MIDSTIAPRPRALPVDLTARRVVDFHARLVTGG